MALRLKMAPKADVPKRHIVRLDSDLDQQLILAIDQTLKDNNMKIPWDEVGAKITNHTTGSAIEQRIAKIRKRRVDGNLPVPLQQRRARINRIRPSREEQKPEIKSEAVDDGDASEGEVEESGPSDGGAPEGFTPMSVDGPPARKRVRHETPNLSHNGMPFTSDKHEQTLSQGITLTLPDSISSRLLATATVGSTSEGQGVTLPSITMMLPASMTSQFLAAVHGQAGTHLAPQHGDPMHNPIRQHQALEAGANRHDTVAAIPGTMGRVTTVASLLNEEPRSTRSDSIKDERDSD